MKNGIYKLLKLNSRIKNHRIKFLALYLMHRLGMRYLSVNLDPVMACNLRCRMCYFTDENYVKKLKGVLNDKDAQRMANLVFNRALKLQIGCGTEPTLYKDLPHLVTLGKQYGVPYISLTTNANLLTEASIRDLLKAGLHEFTISLHGVSKASYEHFMQKGNFEKFVQVFEIFKKCKQDFDFNVRINYTFNKDNFYELGHIFDTFCGDSFDILQIRPIKKLGETDYQNFDLTEIVPHYTKILDQLKQQCKTHEILLMAPAKIDEQMSEVQTSAGLIHDYTFCYASPDFLFNKEFDWKKEDFKTFTQRIGWSNTLFRNIFKSAEEIGSVSYKLNYELRF
ncbi:MAG: radical SAM protein [Flavobacteriaceae bacterium]|nr:radical SAM protein [Flavobacteriaceae bacterium]